MGIIKSFYQKNKSLLILSVALGLLFTLGVGYIRAYSLEAQETLSREVIRFHVLANSNSAEDQALKDRVRDFILEKYQDQLSSAGSLEETRAFLNDFLFDIEQSVTDMIQSEGYDYPVTVHLGRSRFPTRTYGNVNFPAGVYETLRVEIGGAVGENWWCVMFPPLCYIDIARGNSQENPDELNDLNELKNILSEESFNLVASQTVEMRVRFKLVDWWNSR